MSYNSCCSSLMWKVHIVVLSVFFSSLQYVWIGGWLWVEFAPYFEYYIIVYIIRLIFFTATITSWVLSYSITFDSFVNIFYLTLICSPFLIVSVFWKCINRTKAYVSMFSHCTCLFHLTIPAKYLTFAFSNELYALHCFALCHISAVKKRLVVWISDINWDRITAFCFGRIGVSVRTSVVWIWTERIVVS